MSIFTTEGIITQAIAYHDHDCIASLFTPNEGIVKLFIKGAFANKKNKNVLFNPLSVVEASYTKGRGELNPCDNITTIDHNLDLRKDFSTLNIAIQLLQVIIATQQPGKSAPELYLLLKTYLKQLPTSPQPLAVGASFRLKTLRYEGLLNFSSCCNVCNEPLIARDLHCGEIFCHAHSPVGALSFSDEECLFIEVMLLSRDFPLISSLSVDTSLAAKITALFRLCLP